MNWIDKIDFEVMRAFAKKHRKEYDDNVKFVFSTMRMIKLTEVGFKFFWDAMVYNNLVEFASGELLDCIEWDTDSDVPRAKFLMRCEDEYSRR